MHVVEPPYPQPVKVLEHLPPALGVLLVVAGVVEHEEPLGRGEAVVELAVAADEAVGEGEEDAEVEQRGGEVPVGGEARAAVGEGRGQRLERQRRARRQQLREVGHARQRPVDGRRRRSHRVRWQRGRRLEPPRRCRCAVAADGARRRGALVYRVWGGGCSGRYRDVNVAAARRRGRGHPVRARDRRRTGEIIDGLISRSAIDGVVRLISAPLRLHAMI